MTLRSTVSELAVTTALVAFPCTSCADEAASKEAAPMGKATLQVLLAYEAHLADGPFQPFPFDSPTPPIPHVGDRLWIDAQTEPGNHLYVLGSDLDWRCWRVAASEPQKSAIRSVFPKGWILDEGQAAMRVLTVVASAEAIPELDALDRVDCGTGSPGLYRTDGVCGLLASLRDLAPPQVQGLVKPPRAFLDVGDRRVPATVGRNGGEQKTALQFFFARGP
jgi:hypothetical protein